jgi:hypothetical protein
VSFDAPGSKAVMIWISTCEVAVLDKVSFRVAAAKGDVLVMAHFKKRLLHGVRKRLEKRRVGLTLYDDGPDERNLQDSSNRLDPMSVQMC